MSTLDRALAKIYGQPDSASQSRQRCESADPERPAEETDVQCSADESHARCGADVDVVRAEEDADGRSMAADKLAEPPEPTFDDDPDQPAEPADVSASDAFDGSEKAADFESPVLELPQATFRIDGPLSNIVEPPHLALAEVESTEPQQQLVAESQAGADANSEIKAAEDGEPGPELSEHSDAAAETAEESAEQPTSETGETEAGGKTEESLSPEWEVDRFRWPETCQQLLHGKDEAFESAIESLRSKCGEGRLIVAFVSENSGDGASTTALCIARHAAQLGQRVLLVDADVSAPKLATLVGLNTPCSWHDSVTGDLPLAESLVLSVEDRLCLMPLHADCQQSSLILSDPRVAELLRQASHANDLVILDCGSLDRLSQRLEGSQLPWDAAVVVRNASGPREEKPSEAAQPFRSLGVDKIFFVENFVRERTPVDDKLQNSAA